MEASYNGAEAHITSLDSCKISSRRLPNFFPNPLSLDRADKCGAWSGDDGDVVKNCVSEFFQFSLNLFRSNPMNVYI